MKVASRILEAKPPILYLISDGPRSHVKGEDELCVELRALVENLPWECPVETIYSEENLGCGKRVSTGITEVLKKEESVIILEDDVLPHIDFFRFCDELLSYYWNDESVYMVSGLQRHEKMGDNNGYVFNFHTLIWGWATWRRAWKNYIYDYSTYFKDKEYISSLVSMRYRDSIKDAEQIVGNMCDLSKQYNSWSSQWVLCQIRNRGYCISPNWNLVENLGFDSKSTNLKNLDDHWASGYKGYSFDFPIRHPYPGILASAINHLDNGDLQIAMEYAEEGIIKYPLEIRLYIVLATSSHALGDLKKAKEACETALKIDPENSMAKGIINMLLTCI